MICLQGREKNRECRNTNYVACLLRSGSRVFFRPSAAADDSDAKPMSDDLRTKPKLGRNLFAAVVVGVVTAVSFGVGGFFLIFDPTGSMGWVLFFLLPCITGFATALVARNRNIAIASLIIGLLFCSAILLALGVEGFVCVIMSAPVIAAGLTVGALFGWAFQALVIDRFRKSGTMTMLVLMVLPFFLIGANRAEKPSRRIPRAETVTSTMIVNAPPETVWNELKSLDTIKARKSFLMKIGLPVPVSCVMEGEGVGARRTCYFESGHIEERITEWNPPHSMKMEITASDVPGRPWLTFQDASYEISRNNGKTTITRKTTIVSRLSPAWYWRRLERFGVRNEHEYLFEALTNKINGAK